MILQASSKQYESEQRKVKARRMGWPALQFIQDFQDFSWPGFQDFSW